jgi:PBP1b-binding outer membrane lipoprotein LpoB
MKIAVILLCCVMFLSGCISISSGERKVQETTETTTLGQRLMDLKAEYDRGAITEQQYNQRRQRLLQGG